MAEKFSSERIQTYKEIFDIHKELSDKQIDILVKKMEFLNAEEDKRVQKILDSSQKINDKLYGIGWGVLGIHIFIALLYWSK